MQQSDQAESGQAVIGERLQGRKVQLARDRWMEHLNAVILVSEQGRQKLMV